MNFDEKPRPYRPRKPHQNDNWYGRELKPEELTEWHSTIQAMRDGIKPRKLTLEDTDEGS